MKNKKENTFLWNKTIQELTGTELRYSSTVCINKDLNQHKSVIINIVESFKKICEFIERNDKLGCTACPSL